MPLAKSKNQVGLGNSLMNDRFRSGKSNMHKSSAVNAAGQIKRKDQEGNEYITPAHKEADWMKMRSVTEQGALDEFLSTAELAGTDFTAEKTNTVKIVRSDQRNPYLLSTVEERGVVRKMNAKRARLTVPRRPPWNEKTTPQELDERERESLLDWRRGLAELQEVDDLLMTPFERNLEVWRQLWRVIERSDLVVQIVDARNPLMFHCEDLEKYVKEVDKGKRNLLLVNKADMMTLEQRRTWAEHFLRRGINFRFFSAELAREINEARDNEDEGKESDTESAISEEMERADDAEEDASNNGDVVDTVTEQANRIRIQEQREEDDQWVDEEAIRTTEQPKLDGIPITVEEQTRIMTTEDLEKLFLQHSPRSPPHAEYSETRPRKTEIGLVGYPNVGKSSTINALLGAKKVSVSATPGKTKHFQTIHLSERVVLCDCPGLVFPNFATTKAELVCAGILPIDQLREYTGPAALVAQRIPKAFLEAVYGMRIQMRPLEEGGTGTPTGDEVLRAYARARSFFTQGQGQPDESRAARLVLKDYVKGKLLFVHPPPADPPLDPQAFNRALYDLAHLPNKRRAHLAASVEASLAGSADLSLMDHPDVVPMAQSRGAKGINLDEQFFGPGQGGNRVVQPFHYKYSEQGKEMSGRKMKAMTALELNVDPADLKANSKKHFKGRGKLRGKHRSGGGKDVPDY